MARTYARQETQIRNSDTYSDAIAPLEATYETNPVNLEEDMNHLRSQLHNLMQNHAGNWWDDLNIPATLDTGTQRGVNDLNTDLHALERKRVLVKSVSLADVTVAASVAATGTLTSTGVFADGETVVIGSRTYTMQSPFVDAADNIDASGTTAQTHENLRRAINGDGVAGTNYGTGTVAHADVTAADTATTNVITAKGGTYGNTLATTETGTNMSFGGATLSGGSGGDVVVLGAGELPSNLVAAVGAVTTSGTVVAADTGTFGEASLAEIAGGTAIAPKNFVEVVDGSTRDPILSDGRTIYALLQGESGLTDGVTITDATTTRVQVTFVRINATGDDLETIEGADLGGTDVNLCFTERKALEDLTEQDFLRGAVTDVPASSVVTRQAAYDNQGVTPVDLTTNAILDLEGAGLSWAIRDDTEADLFKVTDGSGGQGTVLVASGSDFDSNAGDNDFLNGIKVDTGAAGTTIQVGVTANQIDSGGALTLTAAGQLLLDSSTDEIHFDDSYRAGSTWGIASMAFADASQEWSDFETAYGEVSLLNALVQASNISPGMRKVCSNVIAAAAADVDLSVSDSNLDTALGDLTGGTFVSDYDFYLNGRLQVNGANAAANNDVYPGTDLDNTGDGQIKLEKKVKTGDVICLLARA